MLYDVEGDSDQEERHKHTERTSDYRGNRPNQHALMKDIRKKAKEGQSLDIYESELLEKERLRNRMNHLKTKEALKELDTMSNNAVYFINKDREENRNLKKEIAELKRENAKYE